MKRVLRQLGIALLIAAGVWAWYFYLRLIDCRPEEPGALPDKQEPLESWIVVSIVLPVIYLALVLFRRNKPQSD